MKLIVVAHIIGFFIVPIMAKERRRDIASWLAVSLFFTSIVSIILLLLLGVDENKPKTVKSKTKQLKEKEEVTYWTIIENDESYAVPITSLSDYELDNAINYLHRIALDGRTQRTRAWANKMLDKLDKEEIRRISNINGTANLKDKKASSHNDDYFPF